MAIRAPTRKEPDHRIRLLERIGVPALLPADGAVHRIGSGTAHRPEHVRVGVERDADGRVAELLRDNRYRHAGSAENAGAGVPQIMQAQSGWQTRICHVVPGGNYQWPLFEGTIRRLPGDIAVGTDQPPAFSYSHASIGDISATMMGYVYRGATYPRMQGVYFYSDFCTGRIWGLKRDPSGAWQSAAALTATL